MLDKYSGICYTIYIGYKEPHKEVPLISNNKQEVLEDFLFI